MEYHAVTICNQYGTTYWQKRQDSVEAVKAHIKRYCHKSSHVVIYSKTAGTPLKFVEHLENFV